MAKTKKPLEVRMGSGKGAPEESKTVEELLQMNEDRRAELFALRFQAAVGSLENTHKIKENRKIIARIEMLLGEHRAKGADVDKAVKADYTKAVSVADSAGKEVRAKQRKMIEELQNQQNGAESSQEISEDLIEKAMANAMNEPVKVEPIVEEVVEVQPEPIVEEVIEKPIVEAEPEVIEEVIEKPIVEAEPEVIEEVIEEPIVEEVVEVQPEPIVEEVIEEFTEEEQQAAAEAILELTEKYEEILVQEVPEDVVSKEELKEMTTQERAKVDGSSKITEKRPILQKHTSVLRATAYKHKLSFIHESIRDLTKKELVEYMKYLASIINGEDGGDYTKKSKEPKPKKVVVKKAKEIKVEAPKVEPIIEEPAIIEEVVEEVIEVQPEPIVEEVIEEPEIIEEIIEVQPEPVKEVKPKSVKVEKPKPVKEVKPEPAKVEKPKPVKVEKPAKVEKPKSVKVNKLDQPKQIKVEAPKPAKGTGKGKVSGITIESIETGTAVGTGKGKSNTGDIKIKKIKTETAKGTDIESIELKLKSRPKDAKTYTFGSNVALARQQIEDAKKEQDAKKMAKLKGAK
ncbi:hypothetical protein FQR65_LT18915 [Abscondita terminalis]|nr:hypothetical protein FQR65_LT18915 [Abscondita terminalis]